MACRSRGGIDFGEPGWPNVGPLDTTRPKGKKNASGCRTQLATMRHLPPRRDALVHAREKGLLTDEEYALIPPPPPSTLENFMVKGPVQDSHIEDEDIDWDSIDLDPVPKSTHRARAVFHPLALSPHTHEWRRGGPPTVH
jgi:hypothetical protein